MPRRPSMPSLPSPITRRHREDGARLLVTRASLDALMSVAGLLGRPAANASGDEVGRLADVVVRWGAGTYPPVSGLVLRVGRRKVFVAAEQIAELSAAGARLRDARLDLRDFQHRAGEVALTADVLDHQLVDVDGIRVVRASDLYLARVGPEVLLVGADVGLQTLLRRLGPARWRSRPTPDRVIDWAAIQPFTGDRRNLQLVRANRDLRRLRPAELADLLEELGRTQRQELLAALDPDLAADALEEMEADDVGAVLRDSTTAQAAALVAEMEPDEAVDALRDLDGPDRDALLGAMPPATAAELSSLLEHEVGTAGSVMTTNVVVARAGETVEAIAARLRVEMDHRHDIDAVLVVDDAGVLVDDIRLFELLVATSEQTVGELVAEPWPLTVHPDAALDEVIDRFIDARGSSIVVVDDNRHPVGRILADDLVDALVPRHGRLHFPRILR